MVIFVQALNELTLTYRSLEQASLPLFSIKEMFSD